MGKDFKDKKKGDEKSLKLRLIAWDDASRNEVVAAGHIARLDLTLKCKKNWSNVVQHLVKKWTGIPDITERLQIFSTDEYGKPSLDFITSFSTFTVGNSLCTQPSILNPASGSIPTIELFYHLKVPVYPCSQSALHSANQLNINMNASQYQNHCGISPFHMPYQPQPVLGQGLPSLSADNLSPMQQQSLYPLNTAISSLGKIPGTYGSPHLHSTNQNVGFALGKRPNDFCADSEKKPKYINSPKQCESQTAQSICNDEGSYFIGTDTMQMLGGMFSSQKEPSQLPTESTENPHPKLFPLEQNVSITYSVQHQPNFHDTSSQFEGQSFLMGNDTMALFEDMNNVSNEPSMLEETSRSGVKFAQKNLNAPTTNSHASIDKVNDEKATDMSGNMPRQNESSSLPLEFITEEKSSTTLSSFENLPSSPATSKEITLENKSKNSSVKNNMGNNVEISETSKVVDTAIAVEKPAQVVTDITGAGQVKNVGYNNTCPSPISVDVDLSPRFSHISSLSVKKRHSPVPGALSGTRNFPLRNTQLVVSSEEADQSKPKGEDTSIDKESSKVELSLTSVSVKRSANNTVDSTITVESKERSIDETACEVKTLGATVEKRLPSRNGNISHNEKSVKCVPVPTIFSSLQTSQSTGGIPAGVLCRKNSKPHLKRINPTFVGRLNVTADGANESDPFGRAICQQVA